MNRMLRRMAGLTMTMMMMAAATIPASAQTGNPVSAVTVPAHGRFALGGEFTGSATINSFEQRDNSIVAIGFVKGTLRRGNRTIGTAVAGKVTWPVVLRVNGVIASSSAAPAPGRVVPARWSLAQAPDCPVAHIGLAPVVINVLGIDMVLSPITLDLSVGDEGGQLGQLLCELLKVVGNVAGLVGVLNSILGLITGLLGGLLP